MLSCGVKTKTLLQQTSQSHRLEEQNKQDSQFKYEELHSSLTLFYLLKALENTEAWPSGHMGSLGERNSKPTPSASKNMRCETHKLSQAEEDHMYIFTHYECLQQLRYRFTAYCI